MYCTEIQRNIPFHDDKATFESKNQQKFPFNVQANLRIGRASINNRKWSLTYAISIIPIAESNYNNIHTRVRGFIES